MHNHVGPTADVVEFEKPRVLVACPGEEQGRFVSSLLELGVAPVEVAETADRIATALRHGVDVAFVFAELPIALEVVRATTLHCPCPQVVVVGDAELPSLFDFARAGAGTHLLWPAGAAEIRECLRRHTDARLELELAVRSLVGRVPFKDAQNLLRRVMLERALSASRGSRRGAARILGVTRPAVQRMIRDSLLTSATGDESGSNAKERFVHLGEHAEDLSEDCPSGVFGLEAVS